MNAFPLTTVRVTIAPGGYFVHSRSRVFPTGRAAFEDDFVRPLNMRLPETPVIEPPSLPGEAASGEALSRLGEQPDSGPGTSGGAATSDI